MLVFAWNKKDLIKHQYNDTHNKKRHHKQKVMLNLGLGSVQVLFIISFIYADAVVNKNIKSNNAQEATFNILKNPNYIIYFLKRVLFQEFQ